LNRTNGSLKTLFIYLNVIMFILVCLFEEFYLVISSVVNTVIVHYFYLKGVVFVVLNISSTRGFTGTQSNTHSHTHERTHHPPDCLLFWLVQ